MARESSSAIAPHPTASKHYSGNDSVKTVSTLFSNEANCLRLGKPLLRAYIADSDQNSEEPVWIEF